MTHSSKSSAWIAAMPFVFVFIWSTGFISARLGMPYAPAMSFLAIRCALSVLCFLIWIGCSTGLKAIAWPSSRAQWLHLLVTGTLVQAGYLSGVWLAIKAGMGAGLTALIVGLQPILTALWVGLVSKEERVSVWQWAGLALGFAGLSLVVSGKLSVGLEVTPFTLGWTIFSLISITVGTLYQKRFVAPVDVRVGNGIGLAGAAIVCLPFALLDTAPMIWHPQLMLAMGWAVLGLSLGGSSLFYLLVQRGAATSVTSLLYLVPPTTAAIAWLLFDEHISLVTVAGTLLCALGVWFVVGRKNV
ncbi:MAG: DMT family transporter [Cytophagales bacterium]|nr:DMT family transporter [Cytophagales bacterium]